MSQWSVLTKEQVALQYDTALTNILRIVLKVIILLQVMVQNIHVFWKISLWIDDSSGLFQKFYHDATWKDQIKDSPVLLACEHC